MIVLTLNPLQLTLEPLNWRH